MNFLKLYSYKKNYQTLKNNNQIFFIDKSKKIKRLKKDSKFYKKSKYFIKEKEKKKNKSIKYNFSLIYIFEIYNFKDYDWIKFVHKINKTIMIRKMVVFRDKVKEVVQVIQFKKMF